MNELIQLDSFLLVSQNDAKAAEKLKTASQARILVLSDSHGDRKAIENVLLYFGNSVDCVAFCGDGAGDLLSVVENFTDEKKEFIPPVIALVRGNNDSSSFLHDRQSIKIPSSLVFEACGHNAFLTHGHRYGVYSGIELLEAECETIPCEFAFFGHTHVPYIEKKAEKNNMVFLNPGSLSLPRAGSAKSFAMVTIFSGNKRAETAFFRIEKFQDKEYYKIYEPDIFNFWSW